MQRLIPSGEPQIGKADRSMSGNRWMYLSRPMTLELWVTKSLSMFLRPPDLPPRKGESQNGETKQGDVIRRDAAPDPSAGVEVHEKIQRLVGAITQLDNPVGDSGDHGDSQWNQEPQSQQAMD